MGQPRRDYLRTYGEYIAICSQPRELKHLSTWRKRKQVSDSPSSGERTGTSLNRRGKPRRGRGALHMGVIKHSRSRIFLEWKAIVGDSPVDET